MSEWKNVKLIDLVEDSRGISYGIVQPGDFVKNGGVPILKVNNLTEKKVSINDVQKVTFDVESKHQKTRLKGNELLISIVGSLGHLYKVQEAQIGWNVVRAIAVLPIKDGVNRDWVYYYLSSAPAQNNLVQMAMHTVQATLNLKELKEILIPIPPIETQKSIAEILSSLDDKIELNNKINQELETLAQTLFKQWFIDFEFPNENGEPYKSSGGEIVDSKLGEIPKGWEVGYLNQIAELHKKNIKPFENPDTIYFHYSLPEYDVSQMPKNELGDKILSSKYEVVEHSVLVSKLNPVTPRIWPIFQPNKNSICSTEFQVLKPLSVQFFPFLYCLCSSKAYTNSLQSKVSGTSGSHQRVNPKDMIDFEMVLPPTSIVNNFHDFVYDSLKMIQESRQEIVKLTKLRDTLLPKFISGELEINEISN